MLLRAQKISQCKGQSNLHILEDLEQRAKHPNQLGKKYMLEILKCHILFYIYYIATINLYTYFKTVSEVTNKVKHNI